MIFSLQSVTAVAALATLALASHGHSHADVSRRHHELVHRAPAPEPEPEPVALGNETHVLEKRAFANARVTWYDVGLCVHARSTFTWLLTSDVAVPAAVITSLGTS